MSLAAQTQTGQLIGTVTQDGNPLPGVRVTVSSPALQGTRTADTDVNGNYNVSALPPGDYTVEFTLEGLQTLTRRQPVTLAGTARADAAMKLSSVTEAITVTANAPSVVETPTIETNIQASTVENLPIQRTLVSTVSLAPNTNQNGPANATTIAGAASFDSTFYINGTPVNEVLRGQPLDLFIEDALQETTVETGAISAEYGRFTGGVVNAISKSGGNVFSGSLRDSLTNPKWASATPRKETLLDKTSSTYEGTLGGKIITDRLWFFAAGRYQDRNQQGFFLQSTNSFNTVSKQDRIEGKFTGQLTPKHSLVGSFLKLTNKISDRCLAGGGCWNAQTLSQPETQPQGLYSGNYNGIITNNFLFEAFASKSDIKFEHSGALAGGILDPQAVPTRSGIDGSFTGGSEFCATCGAETRSSKSYGIKPHYFLSMAHGGTHNIIAGIEHYADSILASNHQSGSDYMIYQLDPSSPFIQNGQALESISPGSALILWWPIVANGQASDLASTGAFFNDRWDLNGRLNFNLGVRYDKNHGVDSVGKVVAKDSRVSPRLGITYDVKGNGRLRFNASYSEYVSKIQAGNVGDASSPGAQPSLLYWLYEGPELTGVTHAQLVQGVMGWFQGTGGSDNRKFFGEGGYLLSGGTNGVATQIQGSLKSPGVKEIALGVSTQLGRNGFIRVDAQDRKWSDFYENILNLSTGTVFDPLVGATVDRGFITNANDLQRKYRAYVFQGGYKLTSRLDIAANYTWSRLTGNNVGETSGSGPVPEIGNNYYPEVTNYANHNPIGPLPQDQRHKVRAWASYDVPSPLGRFNVSVLERFDSGTPYQAVGNIDPIGSGVADPGYILAANASSGGYNYFFSPRGAFHWDNVTATDVGLNYNLPVSRLGLFVEADIVNVFNEHAQINGNTTVSTNFTNGNFATFNPFTETPKECPQGTASATCRAMGANWRKGANFGKALNTTDYQTPRTYRLSVGFKF